MGDVISMYEPSEEAVVESLSDWLPEHGRVDLPIDRLAFDVEVWRAAARKVGPIIGRPIRTKIGMYGEVSAWIADWPIDDRERALQLADDRRRMEAVSERLLGARSSRTP